MSIYKITATIEKSRVDNNKVKLQLKGCGKYFFEYEMNAPKTNYNILEPDDKTKPPEFLKSDNDFCWNITDTDFPSKSLLSNAFVENKRLKFEVEIKKAKNNKEYLINSISRED